MNKGPDIPLDEEEERRPATADVSPDAFPEARAPELSEILAEGLEAIRQELATKLTYDRFKEKQIERLHDELTEHKQNRLRRLTEPIFHGLIGLYDDLDRLLGDLRQRPEGDVSPEKLLQHLDDFRDDVQLLLDHHGVIPYIGAGSAFDPQRQTVVQRRPTADPALIGHIALHLRPGFELAGEVLKKERVAVFVAASEPVQSDEREPSLEEINS